MRARVLVPGLVAVAAVGLGLALGLGSSRASPGVGALRTFAFTAALTVALSHLLPEALAVLGAPGLLLFAATSVAPAWGRVLRRFKSRASAHPDVEGHAHGHAALSAGYLGLVVHHVGDGLGLGAYSELPGGPAAHADVLVALAVHTVPLVAVVTLAFRSVGGTREAVMRAAGLAAASVGGVVLSGLVPEALVRSLSAWIAAGVAGLLMHVVTHDLGRDLPATTPARALDVAAACVGVATSMLGGDADLVTLRTELWRVLLQLLELAAPALVLGWALSWLLARVDDGPAGRWLRALPGRARGLDGALVGTAVAGPRFGILFWVGTALAARLTALRPPPDSPAHHHPPVPNSHPPAPDSHAHAPAPDSHPHAHDSHPHAHDSHPHAHDSHPHAHDSHPHAHDAESHGHVHASDSQAHAHAPNSHAHPHVHESVTASKTALLRGIRESAPWIVTGLVLATLLVAAMREQSLGGLSAPVALAGAALVALPLDLPAVCAVLIATGLWDRGLRADAALAFALMASARKQGARGLLVALAVGLGVGSGNLRSDLYIQIPHPLGLAGIALLAAGVALAAWQRGVRGLFTGVFHSHDSA